MYNNIFFLLMFLLIANHNVSAFYSTTECGDKYKQRLKKCENSGFSDIDIFCKDSALEKLDLCIKKSDSRRTQTDNVKKKSTSNINSSSTAQTQYYDATRGKTQPRNTTRSNNTSGKSVTHKDIKIVLKKRICPYDLTPIKSRYYKEYGCTSKTLNAGNLLKCQSKVNKINKDIYAYNKFMRECK